MADFKALTQEAKRKLAGCRRQRDAARDDIEEAYFFVEPARMRDVRDELKTRRIEQDGNQDASLLQISIGMECAEDFATTLIASFMPRGMDWMDQTLPSDIPEIEQEEALEQAQRQTARIFEMIRESNFDAAVAMSLCPDASVGVHALLIKDKRPDKPVFCLPAPIADLDIDICADTGRVGARFLRKACPADEIEHVLSDIKLPEDVLRKLKSAKEGIRIIRWGWWPLYGREYDGDEHWQHVVMIEEQVVHAAVIKGEGSCELVVARFNPLPERAYGRGPAVKSLPELRHLDDLAAGETEHIDWTLRPAYTFPDDSFSNIEDGIMPGTFVPVRPGTANDVKRMSEPGQIDAALFDQQARERKVKRLFYVDTPEQRGDTPPTATQWVDEMALAQRRIGTPGEQYWREGPLEFFKRFRYIAQKRNLVSGQVRNLPLTPANPAKRAQDMQKAQNAVRAAQVGGAIFPEEFKLSVDGAKTMMNIFKLMGAEGVIEQRDQAQIQQAASLIGQVQGGQPQGPVPGVTGGM
ncbi:MAG: portal protein [Aestuariivirga sp.]